MSILFEDITDGDVLERDGSYLKRILIVHIERNDPPARQHLGLFRIWWMPLPGYTSGDPVRLIGPWYCGMSSHDKFDWTRVPDDPGK